MYRYAQVLTLQRTEYGKQIRKAYEKGLIKKRRNEMREWVPRKDGMSNTRATDYKDLPKIVVVQKER